MHPELVELLQRREAIIADHSWRDRDQSDHLRALIDVSNAITAWSSGNAAATDARLRHYLENASFSKALSHLLSGGTTPHHP